MFQPQKCQCDSMLCQFLGEKQICQLSKDIWGGGQTMWVIFNYLPLPGIYQNIFVYLLLSTEAIKADISIAGNYCSIHYTLNPIHISH